MCEIQNQRGHGNLYPKKNRRFQVDDLLAQVYLDHTEHPTALLLASCCVLLFHLQHLMYAIPSI
jgi:hypothetical protein